MPRPDCRAPDEMRPVRIVPNPQEFAEGSALIDVGRTRVLCAASVEPVVPAFLEGTSRGWVTAEYSMLPRSTHTRTPRERSVGGRSQEIQRLIGRSLRSVVHLEALGPRTVVLDCDVLQADGGTRTAAITGAYVALCLALRTLAARGDIDTVPLLSAVAAISVGLVEGRPLVDLDYAEDASADADFNVVMTERGEFVEVQGTAERGAFSREALDQVLEVASAAVRRLFAAQAEVLQGR